MDILLTGKPGEKHILLGNEAIVRGGAGGRRRIHLLLSRHADPKKFAMRLAGK